VIPQIADQLRRHVQPSDATVTQADDDRVIIVPPSPTNSLRIQIWERDPADLQVEVFVPARRGSPFEALFVGPQAEEAKVAADAIRLVCDLVAERAVLGWNPGFWGGGRKFIEVDKLSETRADLSWIVSWRGTYDWDSPAV
jgi:hypothetical protein